ncbi:prolipoprotein diacylglyceryl transferase [Mycobacterium bohemicum DSM 44277]|uniref:Phosphatidylglycerol--prolipoprotein diacylglyceryl transferase n=2 Tax=Mycobacterium bohemicum TaxID=56425 RepID=A0A1X1RE28_MYCBE|nr:prolipoprotein diacylglyceryl transferase [Mycobacterium bohemicum]MCV6969240.1 prolipoprotein diacylglyceryl transferase [Mycobacterium bohemicum]ORV03704.1 prolipoprotein diacylglyceryl transferase [Mycobacterium bohemicum]CPR07906.1 prolipoprotein diacylglyceryl transferase [Mycobacterium bohemicum DSM 44277]
MTTLLAYFPSPPQGVWHLGPVPIRAYALFIITGIVVALVIGDRRWEARGGERGVIYDIALWAVPFGLIGGRLYHLATDWRTYWGPGGAGFGAALRIWDGGLGIWGAVALGGVGAWIACRRRGIPLPAFGDAIAPGIVLAQAIGRLGNYFNQELYGRETTLPWGLEIFYRRDPSGYVDPHSLDGVSTGQVALVVQPTFLYELIWNVLVFAALIYLDRRFTLGHGRLFALYVAGYCIGRFGVELLRDDSATHIAGIRINSFTSTFVFIGAVVYFMLAPKGREDPASLRGNAGDLEVSPISASEAAALADEHHDPVAAVDPVAAEERSDAPPPEAQTSEPEALDTGDSEPESAAESMEPDALEPDEAEEPEEAEESPEGEEAAETDEAGEAEQDVEPDAAEANEESAETTAIEPDSEPAEPDVAGSGPEPATPEESAESEAEGEDEPEAETVDPAADASAGPSANPSAAETAPASEEASTRRRWSLRGRNRR